MSYQAYQVYEAIMTFFGVVIATWGLYTAYRIATDKDKKDA